MAALIRLLVGEALIGDFPDEDAAKKHLEEHDYSGPPGSNPPEITMVPIKSNEDLHEPVYEETGAPEVIEVVVEEGVES